MMRSNLLALPHEPIAVPAIALAGPRDAEAPTIEERLAGMRIEWTAKPDDPVAAADDETLSDFAALAHVSPARLPAAVERIARRHGPLFSAVCVQAPRARTLLHAHNPAAFEGCRPYAVPFGPLDRAVAGREAVMAWRHLALRFAALLDAATSLAAGRLGDPRSWAVLTDPEPTGRPRRPVRLPAGAKRELAILAGSRVIPLVPFPATPDEGRQIVQAYVRDLLNASAVRLVLGTEQHPAFALTGDSLFGALSVRLALRVAGLADTALCAECGAEVRDRVPDSRRAFCLTHRTPQIKSKWAARDFRRRHPKRAPVGLTNEGEPE